MHLEIYTSSFTDSKSFPIFLSFQIKLHQYGGGLQTSVIVIIYHHADPSAKNNKMFEKGIQN